MRLTAAQSDEYQSATTGCAWIDLGTREHFRVIGSDRSSFLHGMVTNDINGLAVGASCYAAILTAKGAMVGDVRVLKNEDDLLVETEADRSAGIRAHLLRFLISEDAEIVDAPGVTALGLVGPLAREVFEKLAPTEKLQPILSLIGGVEFLLPTSAVDRIRLALDRVVQLSPETLEVIRVERGVPLFGADMTESTIPLEANLHHAIHMQKGCYIGQEVIARATYRGQMNKKLVGLLLGDVEAAPQTELRKDGKKVGWLTSVIRSPKMNQMIALGYVHRDHLQVGGQIDIASGGTATVTELPFGTSK